MERYLKNKNKKKMEKWIGRGGAQNWPP